MIASYHLNSSLIRLFLLVTLTGLFAFLFGMQLRPAESADAQDEVTIDFEMSTIRVFEDVGVVNVTLALSRASTETITVDYRVLQAAAQADLDYVIDPPNGTLTFAPSETKKSLIIEVIDDELTEPKENFLVTLSNVVNASLVRSTGFVEITDNDGVPTLGFTLQRFSFYEENPDHRVTVELSNLSENTVFVDYETIPNSAQVGSDFVGITGTLTITPGSRTANIPIEIIADGALESVETFEVLLSNPRNTDLDLSSSSVEISIADGMPPELILNDLIVTEEDEAVQLATFQISLSEVSRLPINMTIRTEDGTATAGTDYASYNQSVLVPTGSETYSLILPIYGDTAAEDLESFQLIIDNLSGATTTTPSATVQIIDNDAAPELYLPLAAVDGALE